MSKSHRTREEFYLQDLKAKTPIAWVTMKDDHWSALDSAVVSKLHSCNSLSERVKLLEDTIYEKGANIFGHAPITQLKNISSKSHRTIHFINFIRMKNLLLHQIQSLNNLVQKNDRDQLLAQVKSKIKIMR